MGGKRVSLHTSVLDEKATGERRGDLWPGIEQLRGSRPRVASPLLPYDMLLPTPPPVSSLLLPPCDPGSAACNMPFMHFWPLFPSLSAACNMICCYADELKEGFYPWVEQVRFPIKGCALDCGSAGCWAGRPPPQSLRGLAACGCMAHHRHLTVPGLLHCIYLSAGHPDHGAPARLAAPALRLPITDPQLADPLCIS